ncbi:MAG: 4-hydroxybenzoate 3-monooxygenase [Gammaproteobacteria bacterium]|nr:4-hydroxybenzoate 3-monooxygenase [Gammaproteobacteria bacterium]
MRTQVGIVGAGPAGLLLSQLLHQQGIETVILERQTRAYVEARIRAGVLEQGTVDLLTRNGVGERLASEGLVHEGVELALNGRRARVDFRELVGKTVTVYGQTKVTEDLMNARAADGTTMLFEAADVTPLGFDSDTPVLRYRHGGAEGSVDCDFIAGCDGFHGPCRASVPADSLNTFAREYPFAWLGVLAKTAPPSNELIYSRHARGFSLCSMRSESIARHYMQCAVDEELSQWSDDRFWSELAQRLAPDTQIVDGPIIEKSITPMRSFVCEPLRFGRMFLAGDAAHIVPPTGAKGLNLAVSDVSYLAEAITAYYRTGRQDLLDAYSDRALARVWKAQRFSSWMTALLHNFPDDEFETKLRTAEYEYVLGSRSALTSLAENYVGLPL